MYLGSYHSQRQRWYAVGSQPCQPVDSRCKIPTPTAVRPAAATSQSRVLLRIDRRWAALHNLEPRLCIRTKPCADQDVAHLHGSETLCWQTLFTPPHFNPILSTQGSYSFSLFARIMPTCFFAGVAGCAKAPAIIPTSTNARVDTIGSLAPISAISFDVALNGRHCIGTW